MPLKLNDLIASGTLSVELSGALLIVSTDSLYSLTLEFAKLAFPETEERDYLWNLPYIKRYHHLGSLILVY